MPEFRFEVSGAEIVDGAMTPTIALQVGIVNRLPEERIHSVLLRCQIQIEAPRRPYSSGEQSRLRDLFGDPERWGQTLKPLLWTNAAAIVPAFTGATSFALPVACTFDLSVAASKYFFGVGGTVPLKLLFSGTIFYRSEADLLQACPISWSSEARFSFPVALWKDCVDLHYPNCAWLGLRRDVFERLYAFKVEEGLATFEEAIELMMRNNSLAASV